MPTTITPFAALYFLFFAFLIGLGWHFAGWVVARLLK